MTAVIIMIGIAVSSQMTSKTSAALARVENVQYPTVEALRVVRTEFTGVQESLQRAVGEGDQNGIATVGDQVAGRCDRRIPFAARQRQPEREEQLDGQPDHLGGDVCWCWASARGY